MTKRLLISIFAIILFGRSWGQETTLLNRVRGYSDSVPNGPGKFINETKKGVTAFIDSINKDYALALENNWETVRLGNIVHKEKKKNLKPIIWEDGKIRNKQNKNILANSVPIDIRKVSRPAPIFKENKFATKYSTFSFYGTKLKVRWGDAPKIKLENLDKTEIARVYRQLSDIKYDNLKKDCLKIRIKHKLCDWAYYKMLEALSEAACGEGTNEAVLLKGVLFSQTGYKMRFGLDENANKLYLLCSTKSIVYDYLPADTTDGNKYYIFKKNLNSNINLSYCPKEYKDEKDMDLAIDTLPILDESRSVDKIISANNYPIRVTTYVNKNLVDFFEEYPSSYYNNNEMTRWVFYANAPVSKEIEHNLYPYLKQKIKDMKQKEAVERLLDWVRPPVSYDKIVDQAGAQIGFPYKEEPIDHINFAEETLFHDVSDCEDHAILFSHLVRDLLGLDVVLIYFYDDNQNSSRAHLATAICFTENVEQDFDEGDYLIIGNKKYVYADPTYRGEAPLGELLPECYIMKSNYIPCGKKYTSL